MIDQQSPAITRPVSSLNRNNATSVDIIKELDKLERLVEDSAQIFGRAVWVNADEFFVCTNKIRAFLPEDMKRASKISRDSEQLLEETKDEVRQTMDSVRHEADRYLLEARAKASQLVANNEVTKRAELEAHNILEDADRKAREVRQGADQYAKEVLASLDAFLGKITGTIERGREKLEHRQGRLITP
ncbi:MAG: hypothetical protein WCL39_02510 [Armatimonadota bacterium]